MMLHTTHRTFVATVMHVYISVISQLTNCILGVGKEYEMKFTLLVKNSRVQYSSIKNRSQVVH